VSIFNLLSINVKSKAHFALVEFENRLLANNKKFTLITQNVDGYHLLAGSKNVIQMHGNITETRCTKCGNIEQNFDKY
jgi:NAD-dependent SIR2 family protein deacetylase